MSSLSESALPSPFLGTIVEVCIVTPDYKKTIDGLARLSIGPFQVFNFNDDTVPKRHFKGDANNFTLIACFAKQGPLTIEIMQPTGGTSLMSQYLDDNGGKEGIQHVAFDLGNMPMAERQEYMRKGGVEPAMDGWWKGKKGECHFCFFDTVGATGTTFETIEFSED